jgi:hypothetical protein
MEYDEDRVRRMAEVLRQAGLRARVAAIDVFPGAVDATDRDGRQKGERRTTDWALRWPFPSTSIPAICGAFLAGPSGLHLSLVLRATASTVPLICAGARASSALIMLSCHVGAGRRAVGAVEGLGVVRAGARAYLGPRPGGGR